MTRPDPRQAPPRGALLGFAAVLALTVSLIVTGFWQSVDGGPARPADPAAAFTDYVDEVEPLAEAGGRVTQLGLKAGITDVSEGKRNDATLRSMAAGWASELEGLREQLAAIDPPDDLVGAHRDLVAALDGYVEVADLLGQAARAQGQERRDLLGDAAVRGQASDQIWDRGAAVVQDRARHLGLDPVPWLPTPDPQP